MAAICEKYGIVYNITYNAKKCMCLAFDRTKYLNGDNNDSILIFLNGSKLQWVQCVKHLGNYILYDLSEEEENRYKKGAFIWQVNGLLIEYRDTHPHVKMYLLKPYCCHLYGSQAWSFSDRKTDRMGTEWNIGG